MNKKIVEVHNLVKKYKKADKNAVDKVSFYVEEGAFFSLLGPNGAGKTTTLSILTTTLQKTSGDISIADFDLDKDAQKIRKNIGVIFQNPSLDLNLTAEENVRIHAFLYGLYGYRPAYALMPSDYKKRINELAEVLGIQREIFKPVKTFSGGMKRKLEIVRSLMHNPKVLFLDEPTTGLDPLSRKNLWEYLQVVRKNNNTTIFLTTHYLEEAEESDYICIMDHGKITAQGTPLEIKQELTDQYMTVDVQKKGRESLVSELEKMKLKFTGAGPYKISLQKTNAQKIITSLKSQLTHLDIHNPTLEEAYLEIISQSQEHDK